MTFIHPPLVLSYGSEIVAAVLPDARYVAERYRRRGGTVYATTTDRVLRSFIAEEVLRLHRGAVRADPRHPERYPFDVSPDIEVRAVARPRRTEWWAHVSLTIYPKDHLKLHRRWVLAMVGDDEVRYLGWESGADRLLMPWAVEGTTKAGEKYSIVGELFPDQLRDMAELV